MALTEDAEGDTKEVNKSRVIHLRAEYVRAAARSEMLWQTPQSDNTGDEPRVIRGELYGEKLQEYVKSRNDDEAADEELRPYAGKTAPQRRAVCKIVDAARSLDS